MRDEPRCAALLRRLAVSDDGTLGSIFDGELTDLEDSDLGDKARALVRLAALIAVDAGVPSYQWAVSVARAAGIRDDEVTGVLTERRASCWQRASRLGCARTCLCARLRAR